MTLPPLQTSHESSQLKIGILLAFTILGVLAPRFTQVVSCHFGVGTSICRCIAFCWTMEYDMLNMLVKKS